MQRPPDGAQAAGASPSPSPARNKTQAQGHRHAAPQSRSQPQPQSQASASNPGAAGLRHLGRPTLPDRDVTAATIDDAYVRFILYCNPAVPSDADTTELREAFRSPPKSEGKTFSTFTLWGLIRQLDSKEIKTWAELAIKLGVEPPDHDRTKKQSSQKIQQYAVRLKRWMHSMHVDAFFEFLMDHPQPYWTQIPTDPNPVQEEGRDGVLAEDDMALRALLPHIRPRRGRKRPEDDDSQQSPPQRPRLDDFSAHLGPWSAHPDGRGAFTLPMDPLRSGSSTGSASGWPTGGVAGDAAQTPMTAYPHSAITPSTRNGGFWGESAGGEPRSAITPSRPKSGAARRYGAKAVSSAWRTGGPGTGGKTRGRPPINRSTPGDITPHPMFGGETPTFKHTMAPNSAPPTPVSAPGSAGPPATSPTVMIDGSMGRSVSRPAKPSISLQVPERAGGEVRLATPPLPTVMVNGQSQAYHAAQQSVLPGSMSGQSQRSNVAIDQIGYHVEESMLASYGQQQHHPDATPASAVSFQPPPQLHLRSHAPLMPQQQQQQQQQRQHQPQLPPGLQEMVPVLPDLQIQEKLVQNCPPGYFDAMEDRTNIEAVHNFFMHEILQGEWVDAAGNAIESCSLDEAQAIVRATVENMHDNAPNVNIFLINLAAMLGGKILMTTSKLRLQRLAGPDPDATIYACNWEYRMGHLVATYTMHQNVPHSRWRRPQTDGQAGENGEEGDAEFWKGKYRDLLDTVRGKDEEIADIKAKVIDTLKRVRPGQY